MGGNTVSLSLSRTSSMELDELMKDAEVIETESHKFALLSFILDGEECQFKSDHYLKSKKRDDELLAELKERISKCYGKLERHPCHGR